MFRRLLAATGAGLFVAACSSHSEPTREVAQKKSASGVSATVLATPKPDKVRREKADENLRLPLAIKVTRSSPIFEAPNVKSKVLADVDADTALIARHVSRKGSWLKVEDSDGNAGWMPRDRTNFNMLFAPDADPTPDPAPDPKDVSKARDDYEKQFEPPPNPSSHLHYPSAFVGTMGGGLAYTFFERLGQFRASERAAYFGVSIGGYRYWDYEQDKQTYTPFFRFRWLGRNRGSDYVSGPDLGVALRLPRKNWVGNLGYSWGYAPDFEKGGFGIVLRPSVEIGGPTRFGIESEAGWSF